MSLPFGDRPCMHEVLFDDAWLEGTGVTTLDFAKAMIDEGYHPMTVYFPLVVHGAMLIEPTESESKASLDLSSRRCAIWRWRRSAATARASRARPTTRPAAASTRRAPRASPSSSGRRRSRWRKRLNSFRRFEAVRFATHPIARSRARPKEPCVGQMTRLGLDPFKPLQGSAETFGSFGARAAEPVSARGHDAPINRADAA